MVRIKYHGLVTAAQAALLKEIEQHGQYGIALADGRLKVRTDYSDGTYAWDIIEATRSSVALWLGY